MRWWQLQRAVSVDHSALWLPWFRPSTSPDVAFLHKLAMSVDWWHTPGLEARVCLWLSSVLWPVVSCRLVLRELRKNGAVVVRSHKIPASRQFRQMWYFSNRHNIPASSYYWYRLFAGANARCADRWIHHYEICNLLPALNRGRDARLLADKDLFYQEATRRGLPVAPVVAIFADGRVDQWFGSRNRQLPEGDLVLKPVDLSSGSRFERWHYAADRWSSGDDVLTAHELVEHCQRRSEERRHVLQQRIFNHPRISALAGNGLCTVRIVTYRRLDAPAAPLMAAFRMPVGHGMVDNFNAGGIAAPVDLATGVLGRAVARHLAGGTHDVHPTSGAAIAGFQLPDWREALDLSLRAHDGFPWMPFVGWDVVLSDAAPLLLEANPTWGEELYQLPHRKPLGDTEFTPVYREHFHAAAAGLSNREHGTLG